MCNDVYVCIYVLTPDEPSIPVMESQYSAICFAYSFMMVGCLSKRMGQQVRVVVVVVCKRGSIL